jgi:hypothetical protein
MPGQTGSSNRRNRRNVMSLRLSSTELHRLRMLASMARCKNRSEFLRRLLEQAHEQALRDLQSF